MTLNGLQFVHITKTGGTSIEEYGYKHKIKWGCRNRDYFKKFSHETSYSYNLHFYLNYMNKPY